MASMDIFNNDAFSLFHMTTAIEKVPFVPTFIGSLGLFEEEGVDTDMVGIEMKSNTLSLIPTSQRGTEPPMAATDKRNMVNFNIPRIAKSDQLFAREIANIRAFGSGTDLETVAQKISQKQAKLLKDYALTMEYHRLKALDGILLDTDGSVIYNYFTQFGLSQPAEIDFDLDAVSPVEGALLLKIAAAKRAAIRALGAAYIPGVTTFLWLCDDLFFDQFTTHPDVRKTYLNWEAASSLRDAKVFSAFRFGEMDWHNYQGTDDNSTVAVGSGKCKLVIRGASGLYKRFNGPGEELELVNTIGRPIYSQLVRDTKRNQWVQPEIFSYPLHLVTRPEALLRGKNT